MYMANRDAIQKKTFPISVNLSLLLSSIFSLVSIIMFLFFLNSKPASTSVNYKELLSNRTLQPDKVIRSEYPGPFYLIFYILDLLT